MESSATTTQSPVVVPDEAKSAVSVNRIPPFPYPRSLRDRCIRAYLWDESFTKRAIAGYQEFMRMKIRLQDWYGTKLAAPPIIDMVWQQHVLDVSHYVRVCGKHLIQYNPEGIYSRHYAKRRETTELASEGVQGFDQEIWLFSHPRQNKKQKGPEVERLQAKRQRTSESVSQEEDGVPIPERRAPITFTVKVKQYDDPHYNSNLYFKVGPETKMSKVYRHFQEQYNRLGEEMEVDDAPFSLFLRDRFIRPDDTAKTNQHGCSLCVSLYCSRGGRRLSSPPFPPPRPHL